MSYKLKDQIEHQNLDDGLVQIDRTLYKPSEVGKRLHASLAKTRLNVGGLGCLHESTRIYTREGLKPIGDLSLPSEYLSWDGSRLVWAKGTAPFPKGKERLTRIVFSDDSELSCAADHHLLVSGKSFVRASCLEVGSIVNDVSNDPLLKEPQGSSDRYSVDPHLYGAPPHFERAFALNVFQQLIGEVSRSFGSHISLSHNWAQAPGRNHLSQSSTPPSIGDAFLSSPFLAALFQASFSNKKYWQTHTRAFLQSLRYLIQENVASKPLHPLSHGSTPCRTYKQKTVKFIEKKDCEEWYFDLQIPNTNTYICESGLVHHNSGKTRLMAEHLNQMALMFPGGAIILARKDLGDLKKSAQAEYLEKVVIPETVDRFNINENALYYKNGSIVYFMETKTPSNFKSIEIIAYGVEEADENEEGVGKDRLMTILNARLRQKIYIEGKEVPVPYVGIWTYNPTDDDHWLAKLEDHPENDMEVFRSSTYDNEGNLPRNYIPSLLSSLAPWEIDSLVYGRRASRPKGKPVIHGFTMERNVRPTQILPHLPIWRSWDFGFNHPTCIIAQYDPEFRRAIIHREIMGNQEQLKFFAPKVVLATNSLVSPGYSILNTCDPHGEDQKDTGDSSMEYLRVHHGIYCNTERQRIKKGLDELQELLLTDAQSRPENWVVGMDLIEEARLIVDPSCKILIAALLGKYFRDAEGKPVKDDLHDHPVDCLRYFLVRTMNLGLVHRLKKQRRFIPKNAMIGV